MDHIHLVGIGGSGLSAIARVLFESGYHVTGSDRQLSRLAADLRRDGVPIFVGHSAKNIGVATVVVCSSAIPDDNVEVQTARMKGIPVLNRANFVSQMADSPLLADYIEIAVAGTHGKTTTTAMIAWTLTALRQDPSFIVGGVISNLETNAHAGKGETFVIEADEYDHMFLGLRPNIAVVTNVEYDHPDCFPTHESFTQAFYDFIERLTPNGVLLACGDDPGALEVFAGALANGYQASSYGLDGECEYQAHNLVSKAGAGYAFDLVHQNVPQAKITLQVPGVHNVRNALATLAVGDVLGLPLVEVAQALERFRGAARRFEVRGEVANVVVVDDYAHHPSEIRATIAAAQDYYPGRPLWVVWQPHTYSRTSTLFDGFVNSFEGADHVVVTDVYAARETAPEDFSAYNLVAAMSHPDARFIPILSEVPSFLASRLQSGGVLLTLSAGDADQISGLVLEALQSNRQPIPSIY